MMERLRIANGLTCGAIVAVVSIVVMTIAAELSAPFKSTLTDIFGHHWVGKGVVSLIIFAAGSVLGSIFTGRKSIKISVYLLRLLILVGVLGFLTIWAFFTYETLR